MRRREYFTSLSMEAYSRRSVIIAGDIFSLQILSIIAENKSRR